MSTQIIYPEVMVDGAKHLFIKVYTSSGDIKDLLLEQINMGIYPAEVIQGAIDIFAINQVITLKDITEVQNAIGHALGTTTTEDSSLHYIQTLCSNY